MSSFFTSIQYVVLMYLSIHDDGVDVSMIYDTDVTSTSQFSNKQVQVPVPCTVSGQKCSLRK